MRALLAYKCSECGALSTEQKLGAPNLRCLLIPDGYACPRCKTHHVQQDDAVRCCRKRNVKNPTQKGEGVKVRS